MHLLGIYLCTITKHKYGGIKNENTNYNQIRKKHL